MNKLKRASLGLVLIPIMTYLPSCVTTEASVTSGVRIESSRNGNATNTNSVFQLSQLAEEAYKESRWLESARYYQQLTEKVPNDAYVWFKLANTYAQKGEFELATTAYKSSLKNDAMQPKPWFNLSTTYLLNAKAALLQSWENLRSGDPARDLIMNRVHAIDAIMKQEAGLM